MHESHTAVLERNAVWQGSYDLEPYEVAWAREALFFVRALDAQNVPDGTTGRVQISPDGMVWCDEGTLLPLPATPGITFCRVSHFGGWLRVTGDLPHGATLRVVVYLVLKE